MTAPGFVLGIAGFLACVGLVRLIRRRQRELTQLLRTYVQQQLEWSRKKGRAALIAKLAAQNKASEDVSEISKMLNTNAASDSSAVEQTAEQSSN